MNDDEKRRKPVVLVAGQGRAYDMGRMKAVFKADGGETQFKYSVSEWWLEANTAGPKVHNHEEDHVFYVIEGCISVLMGDEWFECDKGAYVVIPGGTPHDFQNRSEATAGFISFNVPGNFEAKLPDIVEWFAENPLGDART